MFYHIYVTDECNLCCSYCRGKLFTLEDDGSQVLVDADIPTEIVYPLPDLYRFLSEDPDPVVTFIGGEPLIRSETVQLIMDNAPVKRFMLQTNGLLLDRLSSSCINRFETILISLDGDRTCTDRHRGQGTYDRVLARAGEVRNRGFGGELIARMTVALDTKIDIAVMHLAYETHGLFDAIHWQIDANFTPDFDENRFPLWVTGYNAGITRLADQWVSEMGHGRVLRWYPFLDCMEDLLLGRPTGLRCGSGHSNYTILTNGQVTPCPVMVGMPEYYLGSISETHPSRLPSVGVLGPCENCDIRTFCGGRCLYSWIVKPWPLEGVARVCGTVRHLRSVLMDRLPTVRHLLDRGTIGLSDFSHTKYNGCEIIP